MPKKTDAIILPFKSKWEREMPPSNCTLVARLSPSSSPWVADPQERFYVQNPETGRFDLEVDPETGEPVERGE